jgi:hypothetical protein
VAHIIPFKPPIDRGSRLAKRASTRLERASAPLLPLTKRLELLRNSKARAAMAKSQRYRILAEEYCFQGEIFSDPMLQTQMLLLAAQCERRPMQVDEFGKEGQQ